MARVGFHGAKLTTSVRAVMAALRAEVIEAYAAAGSGADVTVRNEAAAREKSVVDVRPWKAARVAVGFGTLAIEVRDASIASGLA